MPEGNQTRAASLGGMVARLAEYQRLMLSALEFAPCSPEERSILAEANRNLEAAMQFEAEYFRALPCSHLSRCPLCSKPLIRTFDPFGLDGPWWRSSSTPEEPIPCRHFCVLTSALSFNGKAPRGGAFEAHVGPQVPFVIPRLLEHAGMVAVVSPIPMADGYVVFAIAYFADRRPPPQNLTVGWPRTNYLYETQLEDVRWRIPNDTWDFDLEPWVEKGQMRWCLESNGELILNSPPHGSCPFVNLAGERRPTVVQGDRCWYELAPTGQIVRPYEDG